MAEWPPYMAMIHKLRCPESGQTLMIANAAVLKAINDAVDLGTAINASGQPVTEKVTDALIRQDQKMVYQVRDGVPILLAEEGIGIRPTA